MNPLRKLFHSSHHELWRQLAEELGARYRNGGTWKGDRIQADHGEWTVTLDHYTILVGKVPMTFTRLRTPYVNPDGFRFKIYRRSWGSDLAVKLGMQDVQVGHAAFDRDFVIKGSDEHKLRQLFEDQDVRRLLERQKEVVLSVKDDEGWFGQRFPAGTDELECVFHGLISDKQRLKDAFELFGVTLERLCRIGAAYESDPGIEL
jgi:hypothetical protein